MDFGIGENKAMAYSDQSRVKARVPQAQNAGISASAAPRALKHQPGGFEGHSSQLGVQRVSEDIRAAEDATSIDKRAPSTAGTVEKGDFVENTTPSERSVESVESVGDRREPKGGSSAVSSNTAAMEAARTASLASSKMLDNTPLSSLPSSGSLMRHLFELRRRQQEQRRKLDASIQSASPTLASGGVLQPLPSATAVVPPTLVAGNASAAPRPAMQRSGAVVGSAFLTSTPQRATLGTLSSSKFSSDVSSIPSSLSIDVVSRRPLSHLPLDRVPFDLNTNSPCENIPCGDVPEVSAKRREICFDENSPRNLFQEKQKNNSDISSSPYNPALYRSPTKKEKILKQGKNLGVAEKTAPLNSKDNIDGSFLNTSGINESSVAHDDRPITSSTKPFEDLILEKIKAGVYRSSPTDTPAPKKTFLRKGTGTARFQQASDFSGIKNNDASSPPRETSHEQDSEMRSKVKRPYLKKGVGTRRFNSKSVKLKKLTSRPPAKATRDRLGCEDKLTLENPICDHFSTPIRANSHLAKTDVMSTKSDRGGDQFSLISRYPTRELEELAAFERLEEMAANTSLSSHASTVNSLLLKGLDASTSTPTGSPCQARNRVLGDLTPHKSRQWDNPLQFIGHHASLAVCQPQPDALVNRHFLDSLAHQVAGIPFKQRVLNPNSETLPLEEKRAQTVQFCERGAQILEYCVSECDTASEAPTASDASEFLNMSDLEALNQLSRDGKLPGSCVSAQYVADSKHADSVSATVTSTRATVSDDDSVETVVGIPHDRSIQPTSILQRGEFGRCEVSAGDQRRFDDQDQQGGMGKQAPRHTVLQFSPPRMPPNAASHPIWEAFGSKPQLGSSKFGRGTVSKSQPPPRKVGKACRAGQEQRVTTEHALEFASCQSKPEELEAHKVLLVSKVHELEREITTFQSENAQLSKLKETLQREKEQLGRERKMFEVTVKEDRSRMEEYFEREKRNLLTEKCAMESSKHTREQKNNTLEIINLKEEILLLKRELDRKDSMHNFTQNKLKERIKELDHQKKDLEKKTEKVINLEKENMSLKHQIDRLKLANKLKPTISTKSIPNVNQQPKKSLLNKMVRFANLHQLCNIQVLDVKSKNRNSSFFDNNFGGSLPDITTESSRKPGPNNGSPYDAYLSRTPFSASSGLPNDDTPEQALNTVTSANIEPHGGAQEGRRQSSGGNAPSTLLYSANNNPSLNCSESVLTDGSRVTTFANGNKKQVYPSGRVVLEYCNGDWEETLPGGATTYYYSETGTRQTTHHDSGLEEVEFSDGVTEKRLPDGSVDVSFPDGSRTLRRSDGSEEVQLTDGTLVVVVAGGAEKVLHLPNGQREVHGRGFKRREYPDGTVKVLYDDGSTKTTYPGGRVRIKDKDGNLLSDSKHGLDLTPSAGHQSC